MTKILKIFITFMLALFIGIVNVFAYEVGDIITFGSYPYYEDGTEKPIEWQILEKYNDGTALVISKYGLDNVKFNETFTDVTWETSTLRQWLNSFFYIKAFKNENKNLIAESYLMNSNYSKGGNDTRDKIFLLSKDEVYKYFSSDMSRVLEATPYTESKGVHTTSIFKRFSEKDYVKLKARGISDNACWWWLRSPGYLQTYAANVHFSSDVNTDGVYVNAEKGAVRPAMKINLKNLESTDVASIEQNTNKNAVRRRRTNESTVIQSSKSNVGTQENKTLKKPVKKSAAADGLANIKIPSARRKNPDGIAVIIGAKDYDSGINPVAYAHNDAAAVKNFVIKTLGYDEENIIYAENPTKGKLEQIFGSKDDYKMQLHNWIKPGKSDVFIYYAGHGAPDQKSQTAYFVPKDADPDYIRVGGYSMETLYSNLAKLPARSITVVTDVCFSGQDGSGKMIIKSASPLAVSAKIPVAATGTNSKITVFNASKGSEMASWYDAKQHGLFTYYFLLGISGEADKDKNKTITAGELDEYLQEQVPYRARRLYNREQHPMFIGNSSAPIAEYK